MAKKRIFHFIVLAAVFLIIFRGDTAITYAKSAMVICYEMIIPTLFPFFICSGLLIYSGFCESLSKLFAPVMKPLFGINPNGSAAFVLGIISGYPLGAVTACQLYEANYITKTEAERLLAFCNNSGPLFILGSVGISLYAGLPYGIILYAAHILGAVAVGVLFRFYKKGSYTAPSSTLGVQEMTLGEAFGTVLQNSIKNILTVCAAVLFFSVISRLIMDYIDINAWINPILYGLTEFVTGTVMLSHSALNLTQKLILSSFIVGFAGLSVHIQVLAVVARYHLSLKPYLLGKVLHGILAAGFTWIILQFYPLPVSTFRGPAALGISGGFWANSLYLLMGVAVLTGLWLIHRGILALQANHKAFRVNTSSAGAPPASK